MKHLLLLCCCCMVLLSAASCGGKSLTLASVDDQTLGGTNHDGLSRGVSAVVGGGSGGDCIAGDPAYSTDLTGGEEQVLANPSGPASGPIVTDPDTAFSVSATYHDEKPINNFPGFTPTYQVYDLAGNLISSGAPTQSPGSPVGGGVKDDKNQVLLTVNFPNGLPEGDYKIVLTAWDGDQNKKGGDYGTAIWYVTNPCTGEPPCTDCPPDDDDTPCIANDSNYAPTLEGTEIVLGKPSGPSNGPIVTDPDTALTLTAIYHDEWPIDTAPYGPEYKIYDADGNEVDSGTPDVGDAPAGSGTGLKETKYLSLLTIDLPDGLPEGTYKITLIAYDGDQNHRGGDWGLVTWYVTNPCTGTPPPPPPTCGDCDHGCKCGGSCSCDHCNKCSGSCGCHKEKKPKCSKCGSDCKCHGKCDSGKCGKCGKSCGCHKKPKCDKCSSKCSKCSHNRDSCSCHGYCKSKCNHCSRSCSKCNHHKDCSCHGACKCKQPKPCSPPPPPPCTTPPPPPCKTPPPCTTPPPPCNTPPPPCTTPPPCKTPPPPCTTPPSCNTPPKPCSSHPKNCSCNTCKNKNDCKDGKIGDCDAGKGNNYKCKK